MSASSAEQLDALLSALDELPPDRGPSYRGYAVPDGRPRTVMSAVLVATSRDPLPIETFVAGGLEVSVVEEIDPDGDRDEQPEFTLEQLEDQMRAAIEEARGRPPVEDVTPGKFVGPPT